MKEKTEFQKGQVVRLKSDTSKKGVVVEIFTLKPENRFLVFLDNQMQNFYASQLLPQEPNATKLKHTSLDEFNAQLTALQISFPGLSTLYSLNSAKVDFIPYQFRPVLRFIRSDRPRLLIADSVGVGKTIEAGLILRELQARREIRSVLIICPKPLVTEKKWLLEMKRFNERFTHLDGQNLKFCLEETYKDGEWPQNLSKVIVPFSLFDEELLFGSNGKTRKKMGLLKLNPPPRFDLVIVDEAHHIRNTSTFTHKGVKFFCDNADAVVFLTATPIQTANNDLFVLLNTLRPDLVIDKKSFEVMSEPNPFINIAVNFMRAKKTGWEKQSLEALQKASQTYWGTRFLENNPAFQIICESLQKNDVSEEMRVKLISKTEKLHTFSGLINRTRRRDIGNFTLRRPESVYIRFTENQQKLHDEILKIQAEIFSRIHFDISIKFLMSTIRRQVASCVFGLVPFLEAILTRHFEELSLFEIDEEESFSDVFSQKEIKSEITKILTFASSLELSDPKFDALKKIISEKQSMPNNKIMLFSSFLHTLNYLFKRLKTHSLRVGLVTGKTPDEERLELRSRFELPKENHKALDLLLFSEIGCEGLDYQFCDCLVNYDLPWNPMKVEQRIGRIDRKGQKSETVSIINLITPETVDADIYERCLLRIGVFESALSGSEEILGKIASEIRNIADNLELMPSERREKLQQLAENEIRLVHEQEELEQKQLELFGIRLPQEQISQEIEDATSFWLSAKSIELLVKSYLQKKIGSSQEFILGEKALKTLRLAQEARNELLSDFRNLLHKQNSPDYSFS